MRIENFGTSGWKAVTEYSDIRSRQLVKCAGFRWKPEHKAWVTSSASAAATVISSLGPDDEVADDVVEAITAAASREATEHESTVAASRAMDADIHVPAPAGLEYLPYQRGGIAFLRDRLAGGAKGVLLADEMGLGKTIQVIGFMNILLAEAGRERVRTLVVAPKIALLNWRAELEKWLVKPHSIAVWTTKAQPNADIIIVNYDIVAKLRAALADTQRPWDLLVCDESHALKDQKAQRTKAVLGAGKAQPPLPAHRRIFVTGTPILNRPIELFPVLRGCGVDFATDYYRFAKRYCGGHSTKYGFNASGTSNLDELQQQLRSGVMVRRLKTDVLSELPDKRRQIVMVDPAGSAALRKALRDEAGGLKQTREAEKAAEKAVAVAETGGDKAAYDHAVKRLSSIGASNLAIIAELRQRTALAKAPTLIENVTEMLSVVPDAILVFAHHRSVIDRLAEGFHAAGYNPAIIHGETSMQDRQQAQDDASHHCGCSTSRSFWNRWRGGGSVCKRRAGCRPTAICPIIP